VSPPRLSDRPGRILLGALVVEVGSRGSVRAEPGAAEAVPHAMEMALPSMRFDGRRLEES
jgi:hypothetical protein